MSAVRATWDKLVGYYKVNHATDLEALNPPAMPEELKALEKALPSSIMRLPLPYVEFLKIHNGAKGRKATNGDMAIFSIIAWEPLSVIEVLKNHEYLDFEMAEGTFGDNRAKAGDGVKAMWWNTKWLPIMENASGDHICIDFDPAPGGKIGQIIHYYHDWEDRRVIADDFGKWFEIAVTEHIALSEKWKAEKAERAKSRIPAWLQWIFK